MATVIFQDDDGLWHNTEEEEKKEQGLASFYADLVGPNATLGFSTDSNAATKIDNNTIANVMVQKQSQQNRIDKQTEIFKPLATSPSGEDALNDLLADQTQDKELRAAAAQATYPGVKATIGSKGEISFSAAPGSDLGFNYPNAARKTSTQNNLPVAIQASELTKNIQSQIAAIQNSGDYAEITSTYQNLMTSVAEYKKSKVAGLQNSVGASLGIDGIESQLQADRQLDQEFYNQNYGGQYLGPTEESLRTIGTYQQVRAERDKQVEDLLANDPEIMMVNAQVQSIEALVNKRLGETITPASNLVPSADVDNVVSVLFGSNKTPTAAERLNINKTLATANPNTVEYKALQFSRMDTPALTMTAVVGKGPEVDWATNALSTRLTNPAIINQLRSELAQFDTKYKPNLTEEQQQEFMILPGTSQKDKELQELNNKVKKFQIIMDVQQANRRKAFETSIPQWEAPQDSQIRDEVVAIRSALEKERAGKKGLEAMITLDDVLSRMDWSNTDPAKATAMVSYINSQATNISDSDLYGPPAGYGNPVMTRSLVDAAITRSRLVNSGAAMLDPATFTSLTW